MVSGLARCSFALRPAGSLTRHRAFCTKGFEHFITSMLASAATGWSESCRVGLVTLPLEFCAFVTAHCRVEIWRAACRSWPICCRPFRRRCLIRPRPSHVSRSRSSNRTCSFTPSGFRSRGFMRSLTSGWPWSPKAGAIQSHGEVPRGRAGLLDSLDCGVYRSTSKMHRCGSRSSTKY